MERRRRVRAAAAPVGVALLGAGAVGLVAVVDPNEPGHYPTCPFLWVTGLFCPGCGALRTVHALAHLDLAAAASSNVVVLAAVPLLTVWWLRWTYRAWTGAPRRWLAPTWSLWTLIGVVTAFWVLRNLPGFELLAPGAG